MNIVIITGQHLISNPRVWKEANALQAAGHNITIYTTWHSKLKLNHDRLLINSSINYKSGFSLILTIWGFPIIVYAKLLKKLAVLIYRHFNISSIYQEVYMPNFQIIKLKKSISDLFICHQEAGLFIGNKLIKKGYNVAFDFEDLYSEDYLNKNRPQSLIKKAELLALDHAKYITCPSVSIQNALKKTDRHTSPIHVIYNSFPYTNLKKSSVEKISNSIVWFSQTIGPSRGIEELLKALKLVKLNLNLYLIGNVSEKYQKYLAKELAETSHCVSFIPTMSHKYLLEYLLHFQIGLALELSQSVSRDLTITNKLILYLQMGLKTIASNTTGQLELKDYFPDQITYVDLNDTISFANTIEAEMLQQESERIYPFNNKFSWESSKDTLVKLVQNTLQN